MGRISLFASITTVFFFIQTAKAANTNYKIVFDHLAKKLIAENSSQHNAAHRKLAYFGCQPKHTRMVINSLCSQMYSKHRRSILEEVLANDNPVVVQLAVSELNNFRDSPPDVAKLIGESPKRFFVRFVLHGFARRQNDKLDGLAESAPAVIARDRVSSRHRLVYSSELKNGVQDPVNVQWFVSKETIAPGKWLNVHIKTSEQSDSLLLTVGLESLAAFREGTGLPKQKDSDHDQWPVKHEEFSTKMLIQLDQPRIITWRRDLDGQPSQWAEVVVNQLSPTDQIIEDFAARIDDETVFRRLRLLRDR